MLCIEYRVEGGGKDQTRKSYLSGFLIFVFFVPKLNVKMHFQVYNFLDSNENYMTLKIFRNTVICV